MSTDHAGPCPGCGHDLGPGVHDPRDGCLSGWKWDEQGIATQEGCDCPLALSGAMR